MERKLSLKPHCRLDYTRVMFGAGKKPVILMESVGNKLKPLTNLKKSLVLWTLMFKNKSR